MKLQLKHALLALLLVGFTQAQAQDPEKENIEEIPANGRTYQQIWDSLSTQLDKSRIPYGALAERVYSGAYLSEFKEKDTLNANMILQMLTDVSHSQLPKMRKPIDYEAIDRDCYNQSLESKLPMLLLNTRMSRIKEDAFKTGALKDGDLIADGDRAQNPYESFTLTAAGTTVMQVHADRPYTFTLKPEHIIADGKEIISHLEIADIKSSKTVLLKPGSVASTVFEGAGTHYLRVRTLFLGGRSFENIMRIEAIDPPSVPLSTHISCEPQHRVIESDLPIKGYGEATATTTWIDYHIFYRYKADGVTCEEKLKKPVIVTDGFDPLDSRNYNTLYKDYFKNQSNVKISEELRLAGFDVILVNFPVLGHDGANTNVPIPRHVKSYDGQGTVSIVDKIGRDGGTDVIERNAMAVVKLIQTLNESLRNNNSAEQLVVVGPSMGGQITRYALAFMEKQNSLGVANMDHRTRLWLSYDSPHEGANIALGHQLAFDFFGNVMGTRKAKKALDEKLLSKAARQMLIEQLGGLNNSAPERVDFYNKLTTNGLAGSNGYPVNLRKVTFSNGSASGQKQHYEGAQVIDAWGKKLTWLGGGIKFFINQTYFMPHYGQYSKLCRTRGAFAPTWRNWRLRVITNDYHVVNVNPRGSMDAVPGSDNDVQSEIKKEFVPALEEGGIRRRDQYWNIKNGMTFMPTISTLGFKNSNFNWNNRVDDRNLLCTNEIYFDNYFTPKNNEPHIADPDNNIFVTDRGSKWIIDEIKYGQPNCPTICATAINGPEYLCSGAISTFYLNSSLPSGVVINWNASGPTQLPSPNSALGKFYVPNGATNSNGTVKAIITPTLNGKQCGAAVEIEKKITYGDVFTIQHSAYCNVCSSFDAMVVPAIPGNTYQWSEDNGATWFPVTTNSGRMIYKSNRGQTRFYRVKVFAPNCGKVWESFGLIEIYNPHGNVLQPLANGEDKITLSPNPTNDKWVAMLPISWEDGGQVNISISTTEGRLIKTISQISSSRLEINAKELPAGVYFIKIQSATASHSFKAVKM